MTILVPIGSGELREHVLAEAIRIGCGLQENLAVVHYVEGEVPRGRMQLLQDELRQRMAEEAVTATYRAESISLSGAKDETRIGHVVARTADDIDATYVVMGHTSKGLLERMRHGSAAKYVMEHVDVPVVVVPDSMA